MYPFFIPFIFRYTRLGDSATALCSLQRAQFVASCELIMGRKQVQEYSNQIIQNHPTVTFIVDEQDHQQ